MKLFKLGLIEKDHNQIVMTSLVDPEGNVADIAAISQDIAEQVRKATRSIPETEEDKIIGHSFTTIARALMAPLIKENFGAQQVSYITSDMFTYYAMLTGLIAGCVLGATISSQYSIKTVIIPYEKDNESKIIRALLAKLDIWLSLHSSEKSEEEIRQQLIEKEKYSTEEFDLMESLYAD